MQVRFTRWPGVLACVLWASAVWGAEPVDAARMEHLLASGRAAYEDGLYSLASRRLEDVLRIAPGHAAETALWLARVRLAQGRAAEAAELLQAQATNVPAALALEYAFERANMEAAQGNWEQAVGLLAAVVPPESDAKAQSVTPSALWLLARAYAVQGELDQAEAVCLRLDALCAADPPAPEKSAARGKAAPKTTNQIPVGVDASGIAPEAWLEVADAYLLAGGDARATAILQDVERKWPGGQWAERASLRRLAVRLETAAGAPISGEEARTSHGRPEARIQRLHVEARAQAQRKNWAAALATLDRALSIPATPSLRLETELLQAQILLLSGDLAGGTRQTREAIAKMPDSNRAAELQLQLAEQLADLSAWDEAVLEYRVWLSAFSGAVATPRVRAGLAWALWEASRPAEAAALFEQAAEGMEAPEEKALMQFKAGDSFFAAGQFERAAAAYQKVVDSAGAVSAALRDRARFQAAEADLAGGQEAEGEAALQGLILQGAKSDYSGPAMLRLGRLYESQGALEKAEEQYGRTIAAKTSDGVRAEALQARGALRYRRGDVEPALADFTRVTEEFPADDVSVLAAFMRGWCLVPLGRAEEALDVFTRFVTEYPDSPWRSAALFWLGEYHFNRGAYQEAEAFFAKLAAGYPEDERTGEALYWAGRAAAARREYLTANEYFNRVMAHDPESPILAQTLLAQGDVLSELGHFEAAILAFEEVILKFGNQPEALIAWGRKGDCLFTLGATDSARYEEALLSYRTLSGLPDVPPDLHLQAIYKIARYLEKVGYTAAAFDHYMDVVYRYLQLTNAPAETAVWFTRAGFAAAAIRERSGDWNEAAGIYKRLADSSVPSAAEAADRRDAILRSQWLPATP